MHGQVCSESGKCTCKKSSLCYLFEREKSSFCVLGGLGWALMSKSFPSYNNALNENNGTGKK